MATFTTYFHEVIDGGYDIGLSDYEIFDEAHRDVLNKKILDHYWNHEIGMETISMFQLAFKRKMNENMVLFNQNYKINTIKFNPLETINMSTKGSSQGKADNLSESTSKSDADSKSSALASSYPQTRITEEGKYATSGQDNASETLTNAEAEDKSSGTTENSQETSTVGYQGIPHIMLFEYRQTLVNTDLEVVMSLDDLFMGLWSNGDEFTHPNRPNPFGLSPYYGIGRYSY